MASGVPSGELDEPLIVKVSKFSTSISVKYPDAGELPTRERFFGLRFDET